MFSSPEEALEFEKNANQDGGRPQFYLQAVDYKDKSGNVTSKDEVYVRIFNISDPKNVIERPKRDQDEKRWPKHWQAWLDQTEVPTEGTPIRSFPHLTPADIANCERKHVRSVEEIIGLADNALLDIFGSKGRATVKAAKAFLEYRGDTAQLLKRIEELEKQLGDNTDDVPKRAEGDGVSESIDVDKQREPGRSNNTGTRKKKRKKTS